MKETKFRGKRKDTGEWVYGDLSHGIDANHNITFGIMIENNCIPFRVIHETVGQYINHKDPDNKEIYEDDLLKDPQGNIGKVFYGTENAGYLVNWHRKDGTWETDTCIGYGKVIGNYTESPELLNAEQDND